MKRFKEITYTLTLATLFFVIVQLVLQLAEKPTEEQRIPNIRGAHVQLSAQPYFLIRELLRTELFELKDQKFIQGLRKFMKSAQTKNTLDDIHADLKKSWSIVLVNEPLFTHSFIHFHSANGSIKERKGKYYLQLGQDVFYFPNHLVSAADVHWLKQHLTWKSVAIPNEQVILSQKEGNKHVWRRIQWKEDELRISLINSVVNRSLILSPRFFHYSNEVPSSLLARLPKELNVRELLLNIKRISVNYENGRLTEDEQFAFAPSFEALVEYKNADGLSKALNGFKSIFPELKWTENTVQVGTQCYYFTEINPTCMYFCSDKVKFCPSGIPALTKSQTGFLCNGELSRLTSIKNTGWAGLVFDMIPAFRASKTLFDETTSMRMKKNELVLGFKKDHSVMHEFLRAFLAYNQE